MHVLKYNCLKYIFILQKLLQCILNLPQADKQTQTQKPKQNFLVKKKKQ